MRTIKHIIPFFVFLFFFNRCTKGDVEGPLITDLYGTFSITDEFLLVNKTPDFSSGDIVKFNCSFNKTIDWKITITGLQSSSIKEITGFSNLIDSNIVTWNGNTSELPFFQKENCSVELTFLNETDVLRDTLNIIGSNTYEDGILVKILESYNFDGEPL